VSSNNGLFSVYSDHLGSSSVLVTSSNGVVSGSTARYYPFGAYRTTPSQTITDRQFTGHQHNDDLGLIYMNARFYVPGIGRFASADTIVPDPVNPQQFNRYTYVLNNPVRFTDPTGHCAENGDESCWAFAEQIWRQYRHLSDTIRLEFLGQYGYTQLVVLNTLLRPDYQEIYSAHGKSVGDVVTAWTNLETFLNPLHLPEGNEEVRGRFANIFDRARNVYKNEGLELNRIANHNNILAGDDFLRIENGALERLMQKNWNTYEYNDLLQKLGFDSSHLSNYEPNFLHMVFMKNGGNVSSYKVNLIVSSAQVYDEAVFRLQWTDDWSLTGLPGGG
jgi:RHS repeat-associated protein